jgi:magnesium transporter
MPTFYHKHPKENSFVITHTPEKGCWIHVDNATGTDISDISNLTKLHITDLLDSLDRYELPRIEVVQDTLLFFTRYPIEQDSHLHTMSITLILTPDYFITICPSSSSLIHNLMDNYPSSSNKPSDLLVHVLLKISQEFAGQIRQKRNSVMAQTKDISSVDSEDISLLTKQEETLNQYLSCLELLHSALIKAINLNFVLLCKKCHRDLDDVANGIKQSENLCSSLIKNIRSLRDSYQIIFANNLTKTIKLLTALTIIFSIPNIVASIYGMNVRLPLGDNHNAFFLLMLMMIGISTLCGYWFYHKKWM